MARPVFYATNHAKNKFDACPVNRVFFSDLVDTNMRNLEMSVNASLYTNYTPLLVIFLAYLPLQGF
jgi:hypothetical protein